MSVFTTVTAEQLQHWLKNYELGTLVELKGIAAGIENTNYFVTTTCGRYVLTLFEKLTAQALPFYLNLMTHLAQAGVPCPAPLTNRSGTTLGELNGKPASLVTRLDGADITHPTSADCAKVGAVLACIHVAGQRYTAQIDNPRGARWWRAVMPEILPFLSAPEATMLRDEIAWHHAQHTDALPRGAIHADLFRDNILFYKDNVAGVIDFYFACTDSLLYDVAITVNDWCLHHNCVLDAARTTALLAGYHAVRPFTDAERGAWTTLLRAGALRFWVSRLYDFHLPRAGELTHAKNPRHFQRLLSSYLTHTSAVPALP